MDKIKTLLLIIILGGCNHTKTNERKIDYNKTRQEIIENYIHSYNSFDIKSMLKDLHKDIKFENISNGQINLATNGIEEFKNQAENAKDYFKEREQKIVDFQYKGDIIEVTIEYIGIAAKDLPNGLKSGDTLKLNGKSIFRFKDDKIISIQDNSEMKNKLEKAVVLLMGDYENDAELTAFTNIDF